MIHRRYHKALPVYPAFAQDFYFRIVNHLILKQIYPFSQRFLTLKVNRFLPSIPNLSFRPVAHKKSTQKRTGKLEQLVLTQYIGDIVIQIVRKFNEKMKLLLYYNN